MSNFLYGASIQGIQGFIFETNKLKEVVGASALIEEFCSFEFLKNFFDKHKINFNKNNILRNAGGNIRIVFENEDDVKSVVKYFAKYIMQNAYGITISQAVETYDDNNYIKAKNELEYKLINARNKNANPLDSRFCFLKHTSRTGKSASNKKIFKENGKEKVEYFDKGNFQKYLNEEDGRLNIILDKLDIKENLPIAIEYIKNSKNKIAIIHIDGNKMGLMLQQMDKKLQNKSAKEIQDAFKEFSEQITKSTNSAVKEAYESSFDLSEEKVPFRPVVVGGDDVTVICNANNAIKFTKNYLKAFEDQTKNNFANLVQKYSLNEFENGITACGGVVFCNEKFPFHYAVNLSEALCSLAKKKSKREASSLAFYNIQSSYFSNFEEYIKNELTTKDDLKIYFAPYYINKAPQIDILLELIEIFRDDDIPKGKYRTWIRELYRNITYADILLERINAVLKSKVSNKKLEKLDKKLKELNSELSKDNLISNSKTPIGDILQVISVTDGEVI